MTSRTTDKLGRRSRLRPQSTGKRITLTDRDLLWFEKLQEHGPLPSSFLLEYSAGTHRSSKRALERLTDLFNEDDTPDGGAYLTRPFQQFRTIDSRYNQLVYDLTPAAEQALKRTGRWKSHAQSATGPWLHSHMVACVTSSIELGTLQRNDLTYLPQSQLLERADAKLRYPAAFKDPTSGRMINKHLMPDALFGLRYETPAGPRFRCFLVEADRSTEPIVSSNSARKSWRRNLAQHQSYIVKGSYREHLKLKAPLVALVICAESERVTGVRKLLAKDHTSLTECFLFQSWCDFARDWQPPKPNKQLLHGCWQGGPRNDFARINQIQF